MSKIQDDKNREPVAGLPEVSAEFIEESQSLNNTTAKRKGGPYSKEERHLRRQEVFLLHFEKHMSARKIAKLLDINRKTIDEDIDFWYNILAKQWKKIDIRGHIIKQLQRMEQQRNRLIDNYEDDAELGIIVERHVFEMDEKIAHLLMKIENRDAAVKNQANEIVCNWAKKHGLDFRAIDPWKLVNLPAAKYAAIMKILEEQ